MGITDTYTSTKQKLEHWKNEREGERLRKLKTHRERIESKARIANRELEERKSIASSEKRIEELNKLRYKQSTRYKVKQKVQRVQAGTKQFRKSMPQFKGFDPVGGFGYAPTQRPKKKRKKATKVVYVQAPVKRKAKKRRTQKAKKPYNISGLGWA